jgi:pantothenate synthetase
MPYFMLVIELDHHDFTSIELWRIATLREALERTNENNQLACSSRGYLYDELAKAAEEALSALRVMQRCYGLTDAQARKYNAALRMWIKPAEDGYELVRSMA